MRLLKLTPAALLILLAGPVAAQVPSDPPADSQDGTLAVQTNNQSRSVGHFWAAPVRFNAKAAPVEVEACLTLASAAEADSVSFQIRSDERLVAAGGGSFKGSRSRCAKLRIPRTTPVGELRISARLRDAAGDWLSIDLCGHGFDCTLLNSESDVAILHRSQQWPEAPPHLLASLPACDGHLEFAGSPLEVERVIDGDTIVMAGGERVRLIGIDTPEMAGRGLLEDRLGSEATEFTQKKIRLGPIRLAFDARLGRTDRYGRTLAYVTTADGRLLNRSLLQQGLATADPRFPACALEEFRSVQELAARERIGIWNPSEQAIHIAPQLQGETLEVSRTSGGSRTSSDGSRGGPVHVKAHTRSDGTRVRSHTRSLPSR